MASGHTTTGPHTAWPQKQQAKIANLELQKRIHWALLRAAIAHAHAEEFVSLQVLAHTHEWVLELDRLREWLAKSVWPMVRDGQVWIHPESAIDIYIRLNKVDALFEFGQWSGLDHDMEGWRAASQLLSIAGHSNGNGLYQWGVGNLYSQLKEVVVAYERAGCEHGLRKDLEDAVQAFHGGGNSIWPLRMDGPPWLQGPSMRGERPPEHQYTTERPKNFGRLQNGHTCSDFDASGVLLARYDGHSHSDISAIPASQPLPRNKWTDGSARLPGADDEARKIQMERFAQFATRQAEIFHQPDQQERRAGETRGRVDEQIKERRRAGSPLASVMPLRSEMHRR